MRAGYDHFHNSDKRPHMDIAGSFETAKPILIALALPTTFRLFCWVLAYCGLAGSVLTLAAPYLLLVELLVI